MLGIIRVITLQEESAIHLHGALIEHRYGLPVISRCIPDQPQGVYNEATEAQSVPKIIALARELEQAGCSAVGISCAADPALAEAREAARIPVLGAGSCAAHLALAYASRIGVLTILEEVPPLIRSILGDSYIGMDRPDGVTTTLDLNTPAGRAGALAGAQRLADRGAEAIVLACTGFATIGLAAELEAKIGVRALDPILALGAAAAAAASAPLSLRT
ncbi:aspartate/glutamate racemase family protein [Paenibacillus tengchongensis]|uniref:aspartate/glutamate racemase family protein n=1 Tax=Paenibacillus tengchongensis TaxID=2608684 RepID=UPI00124BCC6B|nr:aspartate/glutamate racemase family protein [Paenibacillus tengchongensis]